MKYVKYILALLLVASIVGLYLWQISRLPTQLEMYIFDTKGKPSIFIRTPKDFRLLIDGGANSEIMRRLTSVLPFYSRRIDQVIVTHDEGNYVSGLIDVIGRYKVELVSIPSLTLKNMSLASSTDTIYETFIDTVHKSKIPIKEVSRGEVLVFAENFKAEILFPTTNPFAYSKASPPEIIMKIIYGNTTFLLLGNASTKIQRYIAENITKGNSIRSDVLIVPHSISAGTVAPDLIENVRPEFVIYSQTGQALPKNQSKNSPAKNKKVDPLYMILDDHRFNIKHPVGDFAKSKNTIQVLSDGESVQIHGE